MGEQSNYCWALYLGPSPLWAQRWVGQRGVDPKGGRPNANFHLSLLEMSGSFFFVLLHFSKKKVILLNPVAFPIFSVSKLKLSNQLVALLRTILMKMVILTERKPLLEAPFLESFYIIIVTYNTSYQ